MSRGCIIALVAVIVGIMLLFVGAIATPLIMFDIVVSAKPVPLSTFTSNDTVAVVSIDPNVSGFHDAVQKGDPNVSNGLEYWLPYELGAVVDLDQARTERQLTLMASPRHLGPLFMTLFGGDEFVATISETESQVGITEWTAEDFHEHGAIVFRGSGAVTPELITAASSLSVDADGDPAIAVEGSHLFEAYFVNDSARAFLALEPLARNLGSAWLEESPEAVTASVPMVEQEPVQEESPEQSAATALPVELLRRLFSARIVADFRDTDTIEVIVRGECVNESDAEAARIVLEQIQGKLIERLAADNLELHGSLTMEGATINGTFSIVGVEAAVANAIQQNAQ